VPTVKTSGLLDTPHQDGEDQDCQGIHQSIAIFLSCLPGTRPASKNVLMNTEIAGHRFLHVINWNSQNFHQKRNPQIIIHGLFGKSNPYEDFKSYLYIQ